ncbi:MAG: hypothetical protein Q8L54_11425 [Devosia sp.]|nr:hypothetical protein [Devosia sp.]
MRYGVGIGRDGFAWSGRVTIARKREWPKWTPPTGMIGRQPEPSNIGTACLPDRIFRSAPMRSTFSRTASTRFTGRTETVASVRLEWQSRSVSGCLIRR